MYTPNITKKEPLWTENKEPKLNWVRTGKTVQELSVNGKGTIILAEEKLKEKQG